MRTPVVVFAVLLVPTALGCKAEDETGAQSTGDATSAGLVATGSTSTTGNDLSGEAGLSADGTTSAPGTETETETETDTEGSTSDSTAGVNTCVDEFPAVVTDIDGTLTIADAEFLMQVDDGNYDPQERFGAHQMLAAYAERGYRILYLTGRPEIWTVEVTNETAREVTERWIDEHEFPNDPELTEVVLAPRLLSGEAAQAFKAQAVLDLTAQGWRFDYAYGNTIAEIGGYEAAGIPKDVTFIIGNDGGMGGTVEVEGEDWSAHANSHIPTVPFVCGTE